VDTGNGWLIIYGKKVKMLEASPDILEVALHSCPIKIEEVGSVRPESLINGDPGCLPQSRYLGRIGAYLLLRVLKYLFCIILNAIAIFQTIGPHPYLLASVWTTLTNLILHRQQHRRTEQIIELTRQETSKLENETLNADISAPNQVMSSAPHSSLVYVPLPNTPVYPGYQA